MAEEFIDDIIQSADPGNAEKLEAAAQAEHTAQVKSEFTEQAETATKQATETNDKSASISVEDLAEQLGWNKDFKGPEAVDAATYILRSREIQDTMRGHNKDLKGQIGNLQKSIEALQVHNEKVYKAEVKKLESEILKLKTERREAIELADVEKVDAIDGQIEEIQNNLNESKTKQEQNKVTNNAANEVYPEWIKENQWYETDHEMAAYADKVAAKYEGAPLDRVFKLVTQQVKEVFPDKFETPKQENQNNQTQQTQKPVGPKSPVEASSRNQATENFTKADLSAEQVQIMNQFVRQGIMTEQQYINALS